MGVHYWRNLAERLSRENLTLKHQLTDAKRATLTYQIALMGALGLAIGGTLWW